VTLVTSIANDNHLTVFVWRSWLKVNVDYVVCLLGVGRWVEDGRFLLSLGSRRV